MARRVHDLPFEAYFRLHNFSVALLRRLIAFAVLAVHAIQPSLTDDTYRFWQLAVGSNKSDIFTYSVPLLCTIWHMRIIARNT